MNATIPLYLYCNTDDIGPWGESEEHADFCGRIIVWAEPDLKAHVPEAAIPHLCNTDIVYVPDAATHLLPEIAPRVEAVLRGNLGAELSMAQYGDDVHGNIAQDFAGIAQDQAWFIETQAEAVRSAGGRLAIAPVPTEILCDIYINHQAMRWAIKIAGATFISFNAPNLWTAMDRASGHTEGTAVYGLLRQYIDGLDAIAGMEWLNGLEAGNDRRAAAHGFRAGVLGNSYRSEDYREDDE